MNDAFDSLMRGAIIGLLIVTLVSVKHTERAVDAIIKTMQAEAEQGEPR